MKSLIVDIFNNLILFYYTLCEVNFTEKNFNLQYKKMIIDEILLGQPQSALTEKPNWELELSWLFPFFTIFQDFLKSLG